MNHARRADVLGTGPAALVAAIVLAQRGWAINLIAPPKRSARLSRIDVLAGSALDTLSQLGITRDDMYAVAQPCPGKWSSWATGFGGGTDYMTSPHGHAWAVDRAGFERLLRERTTRLGVKLLPGSGDGTDRLCWRVLASGRLTRRDDPIVPPEYDDQLIAFVGVGKLSIHADPVDRRLMIEADEAGWAYGMAGPGDAFCYGVITDAETLAGNRALAQNMLHRTKRIVGFLRRLSMPLAVAATPLPCRWLPLKAGSRSIRIGDAQASFDPLAGRGLWHAIRTAEEVARALDTDPDQIGAIEKRSRIAYQRYLAERREFYHAGYCRFGTGFWARRCSSEGLKYADRQAAE